jgi:hypothetical protein
MSDEQIIANILGEINVSPDEIPVVLKHLYNCRMTKLSLIGNLTENSTKMIAIKIHSELFNDVSKSKDEVEFDQEIWTNVITTLKVECSNICSKSAVFEKRQIELAASKKQEIDMEGLLRCFMGKTATYLRNPVPEMIPPAKGINEIMKSPSLYVLDSFASSAAVVDSTTVEARDEDGIIRKVSLAKEKNVLRSSVWLEAFMRFKTGLLMTGKLTHSGSVDVYLSRISSLATAQSWALALDVDRVFRERLPQVIACSPEKTLDDFFTDALYFSEALRIHENTKKPIPQSKNAGGYAEPNWKKQKSNGSCYYWTTSGTCNNAKCTYSHKPSERGWNTKTRPPASAKPTEEKTIQLKTVKTEPLG